MQKGKQKGPGWAASKSRSQPPTLGGREKVTQINVCIANKQMHDKHKDQLPIPQARWSNTRKTRSYKLYTHMLKGALLHSFLVLLRSYLKEPIRYRYALLRIA